MRVGPWESRSSSGGRRGHAALHERQATHFEGAAYNLPTCCRRLSRDSSLLRMPTCERVALGLLGQLSERLGHASVGFTLDVYTHVIPGHDQDAANQVADLILDDPEAAADDSA